MIFSAASIAFLAVVMSPMRLMNLTASKACSMSAGFSCWVDGALVGDACFRRVALDFLTDFLRCVFFGTLPFDLLRIWRAYLTEMSNPFFDAASTAASAVASWFLAKKDWTN